MRLFVLSALLGAVLASAASAATVRGTNRAEVLRGTPRADFLDPRLGRDRVLAGSGPDRIKAVDGNVDDVRCGPGPDVVAADLGDRVAADCETVSRRLAVDRTTDRTTRHATIVEPDSFSFGSTLLAVYQVGRVPRPGGAATATGFSTTRDGGRTWRSGLLPGLTGARGSWARASDPVAGYDARHGVWLAASLVISSDESGIAFNRSTNGVTWSGPVVARRITEGEDLGVDKEWFACDNWPSSPHYGNCYLSYTDVLADRIALQTSSDGGLTWSAPIASPDNAGRGNQDSPGVQPVVRPNGDLLILYLDDLRMSLIRSTDGGRTLSRREVIASAQPLATPRFRAFSLPSADVGADGTVYMTWMDCRLHDDCDGADLMLVRSSDGATWSPPTRIATGPVRANLYYALPGVAADPARAGRLALCFYRVPATGGIDVYSVGSTDNGATWSSPRRLNPESLQRSWLPDTQYGPMTGDYMSTSFVNGRAIPIVILAGAPRGNRLDEAVFATVS
jgi:hypothetical protein